ncbi:hypothetical protein [Paenibacillus piri]|uniref:Uncharacterized protein n=1 Tax=Paenibacillus piri TaxID=2547395 RepID=A0A4R5KEH0_9BACL|nr:hypothetical protein [Paenibacillus piri]TDF93779.1 hypothetical protein E1757_25650 [Paenibacillus piri]
MMLRLDNKWLNRPSNLCSHFSFPASAIEWRIANKTSGCADESAVPAGRRPIETLLKRYLL